MMDEETKPTKISLLNLFAGGGLVLVTCALVQTVVVRDLWAWFVEPTFGLETPSLPIVYGLVLLFKQLKVSRLSTDERRKAMSENPRVVWGVLFMQAWERLSSYTAAWVCGRIAWAIVS